MIRSSLLLLAELVALFFCVSFVVALIQRRAGPDRLRSWMGGTPLVAAVKGIAVGFVTPFCTYSAIPLLMGLRQAKVQPAGYVAFIVAAPVLDPILFGALALIMGLGVALVYLAVTFFAALALALTAQRLGVERFLTPIPSLVAVGGGPGRIDLTDLPCDDSAGRDDWVGLRAEARRAAGGSVGLLRTFGPLLVAGVVVGFAIEALISPDAAARFAGDDSRLVIPLAAMFGVPLYINTELFVPIAASLRGAGVGVGAIVSLTIAGAGANIPEFVILSRLARPRVIGVFVGYVFTVAIIGGFLAQTVSA